MEDCYFEDCPSPVYAENVASTGKFVNIVLRRLTMVRCGPINTQNLPGITVQP